MLKSILTALLLSMDFESGYVPYTSSYMYESPQNYDFTLSKHVFYTSLNPRAEYKFIYLDFNFIYFASPRKGHTFYPFRGVWDTEIGFTYDRFVIGYKHGCSHTINQASACIYTKRKLQDDTYSKIFFRVSWSNKS